MPASLRSARPLSIAIAALLAAAFVGCSGEVSIGDQDQLSGEEVAEEIGDEYEKRETTDLTSLTCEEVEAEVGAAIHCTGRNAREIDLEIGGEVTDTDADGFDYSWRIVRAFAPGSFYADGAREAIESELGRPILDVRCPPRVELREGDTVSCAVRLSETDTATAELLLTDADGGFNLSLMGEAEAGEPGDGAGEAGPSA